MAVRMKEAPLDLGSSYLYIVKKKSRRRGIKVRSYSKTCTGY